MKYQLEAITLWPEWIPTFTRASLQAHTAPAPAPEAGGLQEAGSGLILSHSHTLPTPAQLAGAPSPKDVENRTWEHLPNHVIGRWIAWHAGAKIGGGRGGRAGIQEALEAVAATAAHAGFPGLQIDPQRLIYGAIVALVKIDAIVWEGLTISGTRENPIHQQLEPSRWAFTDAWQLRIACYRELDTPIPCKGAQKLWRVQPAEAAEIRRQTAAHPEWKW